LAHALVDDGMGEDQHQPCLDHAMAALYGDARCRTGSMNS
jgi:hypothetical protein